MRLLRALRPIISIQPDVLSGTPVFRSTRVPVQRLLDHLECGGRLEAFLDRYPDVSHGQGEMFLDVVRKSLPKTFR